MCARKSGTFPKPRLHKRGYLRLRVCGRDFTLGKPGSKQATERHNAIMAAWGAKNGTLPADFTISEAPKKLPHVAVEPTGVVTVSELFSGPFWQILPDEVLRMSAPLPQCDHCHRR